MRQDLILKRPIITEKSLILASNGKYTFEVNKSASKHAIKEVIQTQFKVTVVDIKTSVIKGKERRFGRLRKTTKLSDSKKAIVILKKGDKISLFEDIGNIEE